MPKKNSIKKVLVIGSGPIVIGQAAEFDYAGSQACRALKEEGLEVILVNSNPATIMTDQNMADRTYIEPLTVESITRILKKERPDGVLPTLGGQIALNLAMELAQTDILAEMNIELLGTPLQTIQQAEDRDSFKRLMDSIGEPVLTSSVANSVEEALEIAENMGYPVIVRPAFTMGGTGGGVADSAEELRNIAVVGLKHSRINQVLIERSVKGWKEIEYEVMRDSNDNCIAICNMENFDPVGVHTGDSIVIAPSQTLSDREYHMLRSSALKIIRALGVEGGCNVQYALDPHSSQYYIIEVNPRVSRSSALASKATGYPIAKVSAKIALGYTLDEIENSITSKTKACHEPALDYVVFKVPRWPFDKFNKADRRLGTQMKATGEVMAIERTIEASLLKAIRSLEIGVYGLKLPHMKELSSEELTTRLGKADDERLFVLAEAMRRGWSVQTLNELTGIDNFFLCKVEGIVSMEQKLISQGLTPNSLKAAKQLGFADKEIACLTETTEENVENMRKGINLRPVYKMVDTCAAEFEASTPYYYSTYEQLDEAESSSNRKVLVLGSGPIRIGQGIEFDYCSVHSAWALTEAGYESIIVNNNPETVSTDFDTSNGLYFEPLTLEDVMHVVEKEQPEGVIVQFGGQTAINLAQPLAEKGVRILGTTVESIDAAEDRDKFISLLQEIDIPAPQGYVTYSTQEAIEIADRVGYPVLARPSYVLGGRAMEVIYSPAELENYMIDFAQISSERPVLIDKYITGKEIEVDAICDGQDVVIPGIMEHIERAGVHSGDSIAVYPAQTLTQDELYKLEDYTIKLSRALNIRGLINIQFVVTDEDVYVLEVNPRSSRTVPYLSKVTAVPMVKLATQAMLGQSLKDMGYTTGLIPNRDLVAVKVPVFSFSKLRKVDTFLSPEMKSTGEVLGLDRKYHNALYKGLIAAGINIPHKGNILATISDKDKGEAIPLVRCFAELGFNILATRGTAQALRQENVEVKEVNKLSEGTPNIIDMLKQEGIDMVINTLTQGKTPARDGFQIRRHAVEMGVPCLTSLDTAQAILHVLQNRASSPDSLSTEALQDYME